MKNYKKIDKNIQKKKKHKILKITKNYKIQKFKKKTKKETLDRPPSRGKCREKFIRNGERAI